MRVPESTRGRALAIGGVAAAAVVGYFLFERFFPHFDLQDLLDTLANALGAWTYLIVGLLTFLETGAFVGLIVPGETALLLGGAVAGQGVINLYLLIAIAWACAVAGDSTSFMLGRKLGRGFVMKHGRRVAITPERFEQVEAYFDKHGGKTILIGRFLGLVRALAPFVAGTSGMRFRAFLPYSVLGGGLQVTAHILVGYLFSRSIDAAAEYAGRGALLLGILIVAVVAIVAAYRFLRVPENRRKAVAWMEGNAATRPLVSLARRFEPQLRFVGDRLTPGGTFGLEFTTICAVLAVSLFVLVSYAVIVGDDPGPTPGDTTAFDVVDAIRTGWLTDLAKAVTFLGSGSVVLALAIASAVVLAGGRNWAELIVLGVSMAVIFVAVPELKDHFDRPRPPDPLADFSGHSFPSGHAAHSIFYVWMAVTIVMRVRPGMARASLVVAAGIAVAAVVGLSRVYLDVHYLSDVNGGWALGASAFALCSAVALVTVQLRQNPLSRS